MRGSSNLREGSVPAEVARSAWARCTLQSGQTASGHKAARLARAAGITRVGIDPERLGRSSRQPWRWPKDIAAVKQLGRERPCAAQRPSEPTSTSTAIQRNPVARLATSFSPAGAVILGVASAGWISRMTSRCQSSRPASSNAICRSSSLWGRSRDLLAPAGHRPPVARNMAADVGAARLESNAICA